MLIAGLAPLPFLAIAAAICLGTVIQRLSGQAYGMVAAPVVALFAPQHMPAAVLIVGLVVGAGALSMDLREVDWREAAPGFAGRAAGGLVGAGLAAALTDTGGVSVAVALIVLFAVALSASGLRAPIRPWTLASAGIAAGVMGTITAIGAPPMALLYAHEAAARARAMQNLFFAWGMVWSIGALAVVGLVRGDDLTLVAALAPFAALGLIAARPAARALAGRPIRPAALTLATLAALTLLARALT